MPVKNMAQTKHKVANQAPMIFILVLFALIELILVAEKAAAQTSTKQFWTARQILSERNLDATDKSKPHYCQGGVFKPCVCPRDVTKLVQYRPAVRECNGKAAVVLSGRYISAFSAVVRDRENKDRWPPQGINGCSAYERDVLALNKCSAFKVQKIIRVEDPVSDAEVHCLGASGYSSLFRRVSRITIKLQDIPDSSDDPLARLCLNGPTSPLN